MENRVISTINLNGRIFADKLHISQISNHDGYFEKQPNGVLLTDTQGKVCAFLANGLRRKESPFLVTARYVEKLKSVRFQMALCSVMDKFFHLVPEGEFYPDRNLKRQLEADASSVVKQLYGKVYSGIAM